MVGYEDSVHPVLHSEFGVFGSENALEHDLHLGDVAHALHRLPGQVTGLATASDARQIDPVVVAPAKRAFGKAGAVVAAGAFARVLAHETKECFLIAAANPVDGDDEHGAASCLGTLDERLGYLPLGRSIKLKPD